MTGTIEYTYRGKKRTAEVISQLPAKKMNVLRFECREGKKAFIVTCEVLSYHRIESNGRPCAIEVHAFTPPTQEGKP